MHTKDYIRQLCREINAMPCIWDPEDNDFHCPIQVERCWKMIQLRLQFRYDDENIEIADLKTTYENIMKAVKFGYSIRNPSIFEFTTDVRWFNGRDYVKQVEKRTVDVAPSILHRNIRFLYTFNIMMLVLYCYTKSEGMFMAQSAAQVHVMILFTWGIVHVLIYGLGDSELFETNIELDTIRNLFNESPDQIISSVILIPAAILLEWLLGEDERFMEMFQISWDLFIVAPLIIAALCRTLRHSAKRTRPPSRNSQIRFFLIDLSSVLLISYYSIFVLKNMYYLLFPAWIIGNTIIIDSSNYLLWKSRWVLFPKFTEKPFRTFSVHSPYACDFAIEEQRCHW